MRLYRFRYSPYARKVQMVLDLGGLAYELVEVQYADRNELATLTGGYIYVPVLVDDDGSVLVESRDICEHLVTRTRASSLVPPKLEGPVWAYADFADGPLEDVMFRLGSPSVRDAWKTAGERALYTLVKERKFGTGCVDAWLRDQEALLARARRLLAPTVKTLDQRDFLFGDEPTLADAALYGELIMLDETDRTLLPKISNGLVLYARRLEGRIPKR